MRIGDSGNLIVLRGGNQARTVKYDVSYLPGETVDLRVNQMRYKCEKIVVGTYSDKGLLDIPQVPYSDASVFVPIGEEFRVEIT